MNAYSKYWVQECKYFTECRIFCHVHITGRQIRHLVKDVVRARIHHLHHHISVQEIGCNHIWYKRCVFLLKDNSHNVISYMSFPLQLEAKHISSSNFPLSCCGTEKSTAGSQYEQQNEDISPMIYLTLCMLK